MRTVDAARHRGTARLAASILTAVVVALVYWLSRPGQLEPPIDIVGYPSFADFDFHRQFVLYRLLMWELPLVTLLTYVLLGRFGPFASRAEASRKRPATTVTDAPGATPPARAVADEERPASPWRYGRLLATAAVVALAASAGHADPQQGVTATGLGFAVGVVVLVLAWAAVLTRATGPHSTEALRERWHRYLSLAHAFLGATAAVAALAWFARRSAVTDGAGMVVRYPWLPWWGAALAWVATMAVLVVAARRVSPDRLEAVMVRLVVGSVFVYLVTSQLASQIGPIQGFDDMQSVTGADLLSRGYFPWRDFLFIHGLFEDGLRSSAGFLLFGHTLWGTNAAIGVLWIPLTWVTVYWIAVWASRGRSAPLLAAVALIMWTGAHIVPSYRWLVLCLVFVLLGEAIRRTSWRWTALMTTALFVEAILVPEASFQVIAVAVALVTSDLAHRADGVSRWRALVLTRAFVLSGLVLTVLWCGFLATQQALRPFIDYYLVFGPGHAESGALPIPEFAYRTFIICFAVVVGAAAVTMWLTGVALVRGWRLSSRHWVAFAAALATAMYGEKGLGRFDDGHLLQVVTIGLPLLVLWLTLALSALDDAVGRRTQGSGGKRKSRIEPTRDLGWFRQPVSVLALALVVIAFPSVQQSARAAPGNNTALVGGGQFPKLGWVTSDAVNKPMLRDLRTIVDTYTSEGPVFDFTNSPGYFYYLLGEDPPTSYFHISMAVPEFSQDTVIDELEDSRPELVVFDGPFGLPGWDGPHNEVRHYTLSQYLLDGWTPVLRSNGVLFLVRNDLLDELPPPPELSDGPELNRLWFAAPACDFGYTPNFLTSEPVGEKTALDVGAPEPYRRITFRGWAYDLAERRPVRHIVVVAGDVVVATVASSHLRPDVAEALKVRGASESGFYGAMDTQQGGELSVYAVYSDGVAHPVDGESDLDALTRPGQTPIPVASEPAAGVVDDLSEETVDISEVQVPSGVDLADYELMELSSSQGDLGKGELELSEAPSDLANRDRRILAGVLPLTGRSLRVRVGSCLQWHGYEAQTLYLTQGDLDHPVDAIELSDVERR